jgi:hypothetical protein
MMAAPASARIERITLTGEISSAIDAGALSELMGVPVTLLLLTGMDSDDSLVRERESISMTGAWAIAAGSALLSGQSGFDFYGVAYGKQGPIERLFTPVAAGLAVVFCIFAALSVGHAVDLGKTVGRIIDIRDREAALWRQHFADESAPGGTHAAITAKMRALDENSVEKALGVQGGPVLKALYELSKTLKPGEGIEVLRVESRDGRLAVAANAPNDAAAEQLARDISAGEAFEAKVENFRNENNLVYFEIVMTTSGASNVR